jgi:hypothetical protein
MAVGARIVQEAVWDSGSTWMGPKNLAHTKIGNPDLSALQALIPITLSRPFEWVNTSCKQNVDVET